MSQLSEEQKVNSEYKKKLSTALVKMLLDEYKLFNELGIEMYSLEMPEELRDYKTVIKNSRNGYF